MNRFKTYYLVWWGNRDEVHFDESLMCITDDKRKAQIVYDTIRTSAVYYDDFLKITEVRVSEGTGEVY